MAKQTVLVVAAVIEEDGRYLLTQRNENAIFPMHWEFPGGRVEAGETPESALVREVAGRIGVEVTVIDSLADHFHEYDTYQVHLRLFSCSMPNGQTPQPVGVRDARWVASADMDNYKFPPADKVSVAEMLGLASS